MSERIGIHSSLNVWYNSPVNSSGTGGFSLLIQSPYPLLVFLDFLLLHDLDLTGCMFLGVCPFLLDPKAPTTAFWFLGSCQVFAPVRGHRLGLSESAVSLMSQGLVSPVGCEERICPRPLSLAYERASSPCVSSQCLRPVHRCVQISPCYEDTS